MLAWALEHRDWSDENFWYIANHPEKSLNGSFVHQKETGIRNVLLLRKNMEPPPRCYRLVLLVEGRSNDIIGDITEESILEDSRSPSR